MQNQIKIISISGLDGSGKTTQVQMLKNYLEEQGKKVFYFHAIQFSIANQFNKFLKKIASIFSFLKDKKSSIEKKKKTEDSGDSVTKANWFLIQLRKVFLLIDIFRFKRLLKKLKNKGFTHLITDRYFYDFIVNIEFLTKNISFSNFDKQTESTDFSPKENEILNNTQTCLVIRLIEKIIPRPNVAFYLAVSPDEIVKRDRVPEQGLNYLKIKNMILNNNFAKWNLKKILGESSKEQVFESLVENLV